VKVMLQAGELTVWAMK